MSNEGGNFIFMLCTLPLIYYHMSKWKTIQNPTLYKGNGNDENDHISGWYTLCNVYREFSKNKFRAAISDLEGQNFN